MKLFINIAVLTILSIFAFCSCSREDVLMYGEEIPVSYTISLFDTKGVSADGSAINKVWYAIYKTDGTLATNYAPVDFVNGSARCEVVMMRGQSYKIVFVAQHYKDSATPTYSINAQDATIEVPAAPIANSDQMDLFYGTDDIVAYNGAATGNVVLDRVVAMVNFVSSDEDWNNANTQGVVPTHSSIELSGVSAGWDLLRGAPLEEKTNLTFAKSEIPGAKHIGAAYCMAQGKIGATIKLYTSADEDAAPVKTVELAEVQVETNKKTNIVGGIIY
jgi:hypothetical protein